MPINLETFKKRRKEEKATRGNRDTMFFPIPEGTTLLYVCPPTTEMGDLPSVEVLMHYSVGPGKGKSCVCLSDENEALWTPQVRKHLKEVRKIELSKGDPCPVCQVASAEIAIPGLTDERVERMGAVPINIYPVVPMFAFEAGERVALPDVERVPRILTAGQTVYNGICDLIESVGDITIPDGATLVKVKKEVGAQTKYMVTGDVDTIKEPMRLPKPIRFLVASAVKSGGDCDPYKAVAIFVRKPEDVLSLMRGEEVREKKVEEGSGKPACFGVDFVPGDLDCTKCVYMDGCEEDWNKKTAIPVPKVVPKIADKEVKAEPPPKAKEPDPEPEPIEEDEPAPKSEPSKKVRESRRVEPEPTPEPAKPAHDPVDAFEAEIMERRKRRLTGK